MRKRVSLLLLLICALVSCESQKPTKAPDTAQPAPCGRFQIATGTAMPISGNNPVPVILRIDTETGMAWSLRPPSELNEGGWIPVTEHDSYGHVVTDTAEIMKIFGKKK